MADYREYADWGAFKIEKFSYASWKPPELGVSDQEFDAYRDGVLESLEAKAEPLIMDLPKFDPLAHCIKCGNSIPEPVKVETPAPSDPGRPAPGSKPKPAKEAAAAAATTAPAPGFALPPKPAPPTVEYCNGAECPWGEETQDIGEHMHAFCDVCGFEWLSRPLDWTAP